MIGHTQRLAKGLSLNKDEPRVHSNSLHIIPDGLNFKYPAWDQQIGYGWLELPWLQIAAYYWLVKRS